ncbi:hypothetical protein M0805_003789 [Coniferiporia weirii]|nr:hypothetical protein M0805_003789 [Coniferiporia weirii]
MSNAGPTNSKDAAKSLGIDSSQQPLIPESFIDPPSQRLYILSLGLLCQAIKCFDWLHSLVVDRSTNLTFKWILVDITYCLILKRLRIPRLNYAAAAVVLQIISLCLLDGMLFGTVQIGVSSYSLSSSAREFYRKEMSTSGRMVNLRDLLDGDDHLRGEHTVRMSPISTAKLNPGGLSYCLSPPANTVLIPVLLNNTKPSHIRYTVSHPGSDKVDYVDLSAKEIRLIEQQRLEVLQAAKSADPVDPEGNSDADWDGEDEELQTSQDRMMGFLPASQELEKTQSVVYLKVTKPGTVRLERVLDSATANMARIFPGEISVVPCPQAEFAHDSIVDSDGVRCMGSKEELSVKIFGVPPLDLRWHREVNGKREHFSVERIEGVPDRHGAHELRIPLDMPFDVPGSHIYALDSLTDGMGNFHAFTSMARKGEPTNNVISLSTRSVTVLRRAAMAYKDCAPGKPSSLLIGSEASLLIAARESDAQDGPWDVTVKYQPSQGGSVVNKKVAKPWVKTLTTLPGQSQLTMIADTPGEYSIIGVKGQHCPGDVLSPETCKVVQQALPTAEIEWKRIHECSGDTGVSAFLVLHGKPPFQVVYQQRRNSEPVEEMSRMFQGSRGEIILQPERSGNYTYTFVHLNDANYKRVKLDGPSINQIVHPLASASFVFNSASGVGSKRSINSCSGNVVDVEVDLRGHGPWNLEVQIVGPKGSETLRMKDLKQSKEKIQIPVPSAIDEEGGMFQIDLVSVQDSYGCKKDLAVPGMSVNVRRVKPNVRFYTKDGKREITVLESQEARLPLRLTGEGPWKVMYELADSSGPARTTLVNNPNDFLAVNRDGIYRLLGVMDSQCAGEVIGNEADYRVDWISRPVVRLSSDTEVKYEKYNGSFIRAPVCEGKGDHVDLDVDGRPPFQIAYNIARNSEAGGTRILDQPIISSVQTRTRLQLLTSQAGRIYYEVKQIGDANYPLAWNKQHVIPRQERLLLEQEVVGRPSARFKESTRLAHCLRDTFVPTEPHAVHAFDDLITLEGRPPFHLELSVKNLAASEVYRQTVELWETQWRIDLPNYVFTSIGPHLVTIESVRDASSCEQMAADPMKKSIWVDVAESAAIVPFDRREHFCVGDVTQFQLEGIPPWTIGYKSNGKQHEQIAMQSPFALVQQHPGEFSITSISHQQQMCKTTVDNINFEVHALPSARVAQGREYYENIHEGSQAQIVFTLVGEPPFTFTYQRSEAPARKGAKAGKVLETHTVSGVMSHEYSIYSALEGTWTVTFISDKYCRYPPAQPDGLSDKTRG